MLQLFVHMEWKTEGRSEEDGGANGDTWKDASWQANVNVERNSATGYGSIRNRGKISTEMVKMEEDCFKSDPKLGEKLLQCVQREVVQWLHSVSYYILLRLSNQSSAIDVTQTA